MYRIISRTNTKLYFTVGPMANEKDLTGIAYTQDYVKAMRSRIIDCVEKPSLCVSPPKFQSLMEGFDCRAAHKAVSFRIVLTKRLNTENVIQTSANGTRYRCRLHLIIDNGGLSMASTGNTMRKIKY